MGRVTRARPALETVKKTGAREFHAGLSSLVPGIAAKLDALRPATLSRHGSFNAFHANFKNVPGLHRAVA